MNIRIKLYVALGCLSALLLTVGAVSMYGLKNLQHQNTIYTALSNADMDLYRARLAQADYMLTEVPDFKNRVAQYLDQVRNQLAALRQKMEVEANIARVDAILKSVDEYEAAFDGLITAKQKDINGKQNFNIAADAVLVKIDKVLNSIDSFYNNNREDFEEFNRYKSAKTFKDTFNEARVAVWQYNERSSQERASNIEQLLGKLVNQLPQLKASMLSDDTQTLLTAVESDLSEYRQLFASVESANQDVSTITETLLAAANGASERAEALMALERELVLATGAKTRTLVMVGMIAAVMISLVLASWLIRGILPAMASSGRFAAKLAKGDLSQSPYPSGTDEFAQLNQALHAATAKLRDTLVGIKESLHALSSTSNNVSGRVNQSTVSIQQQKQEIDELAQALASLARASEQIAVGADRATNASKEAEEQAEQGDEVVKKAQNAMQALAGEMQNATAVVNKLNDDSKNIASILQVIQSIAEQTNLLALNAAIEAARAGEHGRGFAVVAEEVRNLASRTQDSTAEITHIVDMIQQGASNVVAVIDNSAGRTHEVMELTDAASAAYAGISRSVDHVSDINRNVAGDAQQQSMITEEVNQSIARIKQLVDKNTENLDDIHQQAGSQSTETSHLNDQVDFFKV